MGAAGSCCDNAMAVRFLARFKCELLQRVPVKRRTLDALELARFVGGSGNCRLLHSALGYRLPVEVMRIWQVRQEAA